MNFFHIVDIGENRDVIFFANFGQYFESFGDAGSSIRMNGCAVGFIIGGFENKRHIEVIRHTNQSRCYIHYIFSAFNHTGSGD